METSDFLTADLPSAKKNESNVMRNAFRNVTRLLRRTHHHSRCSKYLPFVFKLPTP
jgi:hypothetical protein